MIKKKKVISWFYERYPFIAFFIKQEALSVFIDNVVKDMTEWFIENPLASLNVLGKTIDTTTISGENTEEKNTWIL